MGAGVCTLARDGPRVPALGRCRSAGGRARGGRVGLFIGIDAGGALVAPATAGPVPVVALHCSGADGGQWRALGDALGPASDLAAPEHYGCPGTGPWTGGRIFTLAD